MKNVSLRNVTGEYGSLGIINANSIDTLSDISLENVRLKLSGEKFEMGKINGFTATNVTLNDEAFVPSSTPTATPSP